jgi:beta-galactosidase
MNSWERIDPAQPQPAWTSGGFAIYRATFTPPKAMQSRGGVILVHQVFGKAEVFLNQAKVPSSQSASGELRIEFEPTADKLTMSVLIFAEMERAGIMRAVELIGR